MKFLLGRAKYGIYRLLIRTALAACFAAGVGFGPECLVTPAELLAAAGALRRR